jgi:hypothetical protein
MKHFLEVKLSFYLMVGFGTSRTYFNSYLTNYGLKNP